MQLRVPGFVRMVGGPEEVFDAWGWCASDLLTWEATGHFEREGAVDAANPPELLFVVRADASEACEGVLADLPLERARLHAPSFDFQGDPWVLAPWAIDEATDKLFAHRVAGSDVFWLFAPSLRALFWGLHDWVHFHNHGPFDEPAWTELQCDVVAWSWLRLNREAIGLEAKDLAGVRRTLVELSRARFVSEEKEAPDVEGFYGCGDG